MTVRSRWLVGAVVAVALALAGGAALRWWTHPHVLRQGIGMGMYYPALPRTSLPLHLGLMPAAPHQSRETLTLHSVHVHLTHNTARAHAVVSVCTGPRSGVMATGARGASLRDTCRRVRAVHDGTTMRYGDGAVLEYLVMTVTAERPGTVRISGVDVDYSRGHEHGGQHGTQHLDGYPRLIRVT